MASEADIVHLHMPDPMAAAAFWAARPRAALVVHWHSDVIRQRLALRAYEPLQNWLLRRADAIVATSPPYAESSEAAGAVARQGACDPDRHQRQPARRPAA